MQGLLSQADALSASGQDTGPVTAVSVDHTPAAMALIRQDRSVLGEEMSMHGVKVDGRVF